MLPAISAICASLCVRALRGDGISRSSGQNSNCNLSASSSSVRFARGDVLISGLRQVSSYPPPEFRDVFWIASTANGRHEDVE
jgi:hypothetical protein